jgi:ABC-2 type transport system ATP-binding protein
MAAALVGTDGIDSVSIGEEGELTVLSRNVTSLQRSIPRLAQDQGIRLKRVEPLDDSLESIFSYVVDR